MIVKIWTLLFVGLILGFLDHVYGAYYDDENSLRVSTILYPEIRPSDRVDVSLQFTVTSVNHLDVNNQEFSLTGWFSISWEDARFAWAPAAFSNIEYLFLKQSEAWRPELMVDNSVRRIQVIDYENMLMRVSHNSTVLWEPPGMFDVSCDVDVTYYPFDTQTCYLSVTTWAFDKTAVTLSAYGSGVNTAFYQESGDWTLLETSALVHDQVDTGGSFTKNQVRFIFKLERRPANSVATVIMPVLLVSYLGLFVFLLPPESGEKIGFSLAVLICQSVLLVFVSDSVPTSSTQTSLLSVFLVLNLTIVAIETIMTVFILRIHHRDYENRPVSSRMQIIASKYFAKLSCFSCCRSKFVSADAMTDHVYNRRFEMPRTNRVTPETPQTSSGSDSGLVQTSGPSGGFDRIKSGYSRTTSSDMDSVSKTVCIDDLDLHDREYSWTEIGEMVDFICLYIMSFILTSVTVGFFIVMTSQG